MRLVFTGLWIGLRKSAAPFLLLFCALGAVLWIVPTVVLRQDDLQPVQIAVVDEAPGEFSDLLLSLARSQAKGIAEITALSPQDPSDGFAAVLVLPEGFWQSVMQGGSCTPVLRVSASSPLEGLWTVALARSAARSIETAQRQISGAITPLQQAGLTGEALQRAILQLDMSLLDRYLAPNSHSETVRLSATGALTLPEYLLCSGISALAFGAIFLLWEGVSALRGFSLLSRRTQPFASALLLSGILSAALWLPVAALLAGGRPRLPALLQLWLLYTAALLLLTSLPSRGCCAAASVSLVLGQALFGGGLFPEALLPSALARVAGWFPLSLGRRALAAACFAGEAPSTAICLLLAGSCLLLTVILWFGPRKEGSP